MNRGQEAADTRGGPRRVSPATARRISVRRPLRLIHIVPPEQTLRPDRIVTELLLAAAIGETALRYGPWA